MFGRILKAVGKKALGDTPAGLAFNALEAIHGKKKVTAQDALDLLNAMVDKSGDRLERIEKRLDALEAPGDNTRRAGE